MLANKTKTIQDNPTDENALIVPLKDLWLNINKNNLNIL